MSLANRFIRCSLLLVFSFALWSVQGCTLQTVLEGQPGVDTSPIGRGSTREAVDRLLGPPKREWRSIRGITYRLYEFDGGVEPNSPMAIWWTVMVIGTLGMPEWTNQNRVNADSCGRNSSYVDSNLM